MGESEERPPEGRRSARRLTGVATRSGATRPANFHGERRSNATHASVTDPEARLARKGPGKPSVLAYQASVTTDNRHGLVVATAVGAGDGHGGSRAGRANAECLEHGEPTGRTGHRTRRGGQALRSTGLRAHGARARLRAARRAAGDVAPRQPDRRRGRPGTRATPRVNAGASWWRRASAGARSLGCCASSGIEAWRWSTRCSPSRWAIYNLVRMRTLIQAGVCT